ncbi:MAG TPA: hypothetical protein VIV60_20425, partial [Polyangiaceae bacterium]
ERALLHDERCVEMQHLVAQASRSDVTPTRLQPSRYYTFSIGFLISVMPSISALKTDVRD